MKGYASYPRNMRQFAREHGLHLITIDLPGIIFQGPVPLEEHNLLLDWLQAFLSRQNNKPKPPTDKG